MASQSDGDDMWVFDAPADDYVTSRPQIQALNVETPEERVSSRLSDISREHLN